jgi:hypothetical protein
MSQTAASVDTFASNPAGLNAPCTYSLNIIPGTSFTNVPRQIHNPGAAGIVYGYLMGDGPGAALRPFYMAQGALLSDRLIWFDSTSTVASLTLKW